MTDHTNETRIVTIETDEGRDIEVTVMGDNAWDRLAEAVKREVDGDSLDAIVSASISLELETRAVEPASTTETAPKNAAGRGGSRGGGPNPAGEFSKPHVKEDDRKLGSVRPDTMGHEILSHVYVLSEAGEENIDLKRLEERPYDHGKIASVSPTLSTLYRRKHVNREKVKKGDHGVHYHYSLSDHGRAFLKENGTAATATAEDEDGEGGDE